MRKHKKGCLGFILKMAAVVTAVTVVFSFMFRIILVDGISMTPTLDDGDWIMVYRTSDIKPGDIILTNTDNEYRLRLIKRAVAFGGDTVDIDFDSGELFVNGEKVYEPYKSDLPTVRGDVEFPLTVPQGHIFVLGDNRSNSVDSRYSEVGFVESEDVIGKVFMRFLPVPFSFVD